MVTADTIIQPGTQCSPVCTEGKYKMRIRSKLSMARYHQNVKKLPFQALLAISSLFIVQTGTSGTSRRARGSPVQSGTFDPTTGGALDIQQIRRGGVTADSITEPATQCVPQSTGGNYKMRIRSKLFMALPSKCEKTAISSTFGYIISIYCSNRKSWKRDINMGARSSSTGQHFRSKNWRPP